MFVLPDDIKIFNPQKKCLVWAKLVRLTRELAAKQIDGTWWKISVSKTVRLAEGDHHWEWRKLVGLHRNDLVWEALAVQRANGAIEGAVLYRIDAVSQLERGRGAVFIDRLATAPRNRPWLADPPKYRGIGAALLLAAVRHSYSLGLGGRVWLTSLPSERTREFYHKRDFQVIFEDENGMIDYELPAAAAQRWLKSEGFL
jgi:GNAT superfamily N-acetyltransferase